MIDKMNRFIVTEHCIIPKESIVCVSVTPKHMMFDTNPVLYAIVAHLSEGKTFPLYIDIPYSQIPEKMKIVAEQMANDN